MVIPVHHSTEALDLALVSAGLLGLRHGFDYDHIAAISDIAGAQTSQRRSMRLGLVYALGHAATVAVLGVAAILFQRTLPAGVDRWTERLVGCTLLILGFYVLGRSFATDAHGHAHPQTRMTILLNALLWAGWRVRRLFGMVTSPAPPRAFANGYGGRSTFVVGIIHGLGAETPSQLLLFLLAANLGGLAKGLLGLAMFIGGLLIMNTLMCAVASGIFGASAARPRTLRLVSVATAGYSVIVGTIFLAGASGVLPALS
jgi:high-affinity nickel-transport protein